MRLITIFELATRSKTELHIMLTQTFEEAVRSEPNSAERRNALASLENITRAIRTRQKPGR